MAKQTTMTRRGITWGRLEFERLRQQARNPNLDRPGRLLAHVMAETKHLGGNTFGYRADRDELRQIVAPDASNRETADRAVTRAIATLIKQGWLTEDSTLSGVLTVPGWHFGIDRQRRGFTLNPRGPSQLTS